jgi:pimeloyl-ACP methyl ester carboxylesterase
MLARLQRWLVAGVLTLALAWWLASGEAAVNAGWRVGVLLVILAPHAPVLALEFLLLSRFGRAEPAEQPGLVLCVRAWAGEVISSWLTFGWRQPFRSASEPDHLPISGERRRGVLLVHGFVCNRGLWLPWMRRLRALGVPFVAVNLEPVFGSIDDYVPQIDAAVARLQQHTGCAPLIVAHSMGGLATRAWLRDVDDADARCAGVVTIASPHHGTWLARFAVTPNGRQMRIDSDWLRKLAQHEPPARLSRFTGFWGHCDNIVFPAATAMLDQADNRHLPGVAHVHMVAHHQVLEHVLQRLQRDGSTCEATAL